MHKVDCLICGAEFSYQNLVAAKCEICKKDFEVEVLCENGHYVCDQCHSENVRDAIEKHCLTSTSEDPIWLAEELMAIPKVKMHGPEHHFIVPAALLTAYYNHKNQSDEKAKKLNLAKKRSKNILSGFCGFYGTCGAAVGTGIFMSLISDATPVTSNSWKDCNRMTGQSLLKIAEFNGPRCCKRDSFISIEQAVDFLKEEMGTILPVKQAFCSYSEINHECLGEACKYNDEQMYVCRVPQGKGSKS